MKERQRLAREYGVDAGAARGGWLAGEGALQVRMISSVCTVPHECGWCEYCRQTTHTHKCKNRCWRRRLGTWARGWLGRRTSPRAPRSRPSLGPWPRTFLCSYVDLCVYMYIYIFILYMIISPKGKTTTLTPNPSTQTSTSSTVASAASGSVRQHKAGSGPPPRPGGASAWRWRRWKGLG